MQRSSSALIGLAAGVALGMVCGFMMFDRRIYGRVMKKLSKATRAIERQQAEWREAAGAVVENGEEQLKHVRDKSNRILTELAS